MQQVLKPASGAARAQVVAAELFGQFDVATDETPSTLDMGFRGEGLPPLTRDAESRGGFRNRDACAWHTRWLGHGLSPRRLTSIVAGNANFVIPEARSNSSSLCRPGALRLGDQIDAERVKHLDDGAKLRLRFSA